jgi:signal peptidase I
MAKSRVAGQGQSDSLGLWENIKTVVTALLVAVVVRTFLFEPFNIPSGSMIPTLLVGDYVFTEKWAYGYSHFSFPFSPDLFGGRILFRMPHRGDVAVFRETNDTSVDYIKRIIGLPGDHVQMRGGELYLNGAKVPRRDLGDYTAVDEHGTETEARRFDELLPASGDAHGTVAHAILKETDEGPANDTPDFVVPAGDFFAMGDNRDDSADSRFPNPVGVGFVPMENLVGRAVVIFFSVDGRAPIWQVWEWPFEIRWTRLFSLVR